MSQLIPFIGSLLMPSDAHDVTRAVAVPGVFQHSGSIAVALTENAVHLVAPTREHILIPFGNVRRVRPENFPGIAYFDYVDGVQTVVAPNDTAGVTIEYQTVGNFIHQVSFLLHFPNKAHEWARKIQQAVDQFNRKLFMDGIGNQ